MQKRLKQGTVKNAEIFATLEGEYYAHYGKSSFESEKFISTLNCNARLNM